MNVDEAMEEAETMDVESTCTRKHPAYAYTHARTRTCAHPPTHTTHTHIHTHTHIRVYPPCRNAARKKSGTDMNVDEAKEEAEAMGAEGEEDSSDKETQPVTEHKKRQDMVRWAVIEVRACVCVCTSDKGSKLITANKGAARMLGFQIWEDFLKAFLKLT